MSPFLPAANELYKTNCNWFMLVAVDFVITMVLITWFCNFDDLIMYSPCLSIKLNNHNYYIILNLFNFLTDPGLFYTWCCPACVGVHCPGSQLAKQKHELF